MFGGHCSSTPHVSLVGSTVIIISSNYICKWKIGRRKKSIPVLFFLLFIGLHDFWVFMKSQILFTNCISSDVTCMKIEKCVLILIYGLSIILLNNNKILSSKKINKILRICNKQPKYNGMGLWITSKMIHY